MKKGKMKIRGYEYLGRWNNKEFFQGHFYSIEIDHNKNEIRKYYDGSLRGWFSFFIGVLMGFMIFACIQGGRDD